MLRFEKTQNLTTLEAHQAILIAVPKRNCDVIENTGGQGKLLNHAAVGSKRRFNVKGSILPLDNSDCTVSTNGVALSFASNQNGLSI